MCCFARSGATVVLLDPWMAGEQEGGILSEEEVRFHGELSGSCVQYAAATESHGVNVSCHCR